jgi:hypothetical protein
VVDKKQEQLKKEYRRRRRVLDTQIGFGGEGGRGPSRRHCVALGRLKVSMIGAFSEMFWDIDSRGLRRQRPS